MKLCYECEGFGKLYSELNMEGYDGPCPYCDGTGYLDIPKECCFEKYSSRICSYGTAGCIFDHDHAVAA